MSNAMSCTSRSASGTSPAAMRCARPSTRAVCMWHWVQVGLYVTKHRFLSGQCARRQASKDHPPRVPLGTTTCCIEHIAPATHWPTCVHIIRNPYHQPCLQVLHLRCCQSDWQCSAILDPPCLHLARPEPQGCSWCACTGCGSPAGSHLHAPPLGPACLQAKATVVWDSNISSQTLATGGRYG
jgi:hypothetical protein